MDEHRLVRVSKYLSRHLRHQPERLGLELSPGGWVDVDVLLAALEARHFPVSRSELEEVVAKNDKRRFSFDETGVRIRANQGHSVDVDLQLEATAPPPKLYHGTSERIIDQVLAGGLKRMGRHHVHLCSDPGTARRVGSRHGRPVVLVVDATAMASNGMDFFVTENGVWLTDHVPPRYLSQL